MLPSGRCVTLMVALFTAGCSLTGGQLGTLRTQNRSLLEQTNAQLSEIENLKAHARRLEDRLIVAEEELAARQDASHPRQRMVSKGGGATGGVDPWAEDDGVSATPERPPDKRRH